MKSVLLFSCFIIFMFYCFDSSAQCAMCKAAAESDARNNPHSIAKGLNTGILFLMVIPYLAVGIIFRKDIAQLVKNMRSKEKTPFNKKNLGKFTFAITFVTCLVVLFAIFITYSQTF
jgi:hypothetical protein